MPKWDYLIVTASNDTQARAYEGQLRARVDGGLLPQVRDAFVVADLEGRRIGSGGSTAYCLSRVLERERARKAGTVQQALERLRVLILHAGGDSRRLPAYAPCGKIFMPVPGAGESDIPPALFDRLCRVFLALPGPEHGQVVVAAGDALVDFDPSGLRLDRPGLTALACSADAIEASRHGVFCPGEGGSVRLYLQKPSIAEQHAAGALDAGGRTALDVGVMSLDARAARTLVDALGDCEADAAARTRLLDYGADIYREICCALGEHATLDHYRRTAQRSGSPWTEGMLEAVYPALHAIPFHMELLPRCRFLHFGATRQLVESGLALLERDGEPAPPEHTLLINTVVVPGGSVAGADSWIEACRIAAPLTLGGRNVLAGVDVREPLTLAPGVCLEVLAGVNRAGAAVWFIRCYGTDDTFKHSIADGGTFCGRPLLEWIAAAGLSPGDLWPGAPPEKQCSLWNARVFPAEAAPEAYRRWLWMYAPETAGAEQKRRYLAADRFSAAEIAYLADQAAFHARRRTLRSEARALHSG